MKSIWKKIETASAEEAAQLRDALLHQFWKSAFFALAAVSVVAFATIAWFVSNSQVHSGTAAVSANFEPLKLATKGVRQQAEIDNLNLPNPDGETLIHNGGTYYCTNDTTTTTIALRLADESYEVSPGAHGKVEFYVIPGSAGGTVTLQIGLGGYGADENDNGEVKPIDNAVLNALLSGHILLFDTYDDKNNTYSDWLFPNAGGGDGIFNNTITVDLSGKPTGVPVPVDFYWIWPLRYENLETLAGKTFCDEQAENDNLTTFGKNYRYSRVYLAEPGSNLSDTESDIVSTIEKNRSKAYDLADEYIGGNAQYLYLTIQTNTSENAEGGQSS